MVLDERADLSCTEDCYDEAREEQRALDEIGLNHAQEIEVEEGEGQIHHHCQLDLELIYLKVLQDLMG